MAIPSGALVLVADGRKYLFLRNHGSPFEPVLEVEARHEKTNPATRDQGTDSPGRAAAANGTNRSAMEETDFHQLEEDRFASETADLLCRRALGGDFDKLVVVAPPRTLGELRKHYKKAVTKRLVAEVPKDLTGHPVAAIAQLLGA